MPFGIQHFIQKFRLALLLGFLASGSVLTLRTISGFQLLELRSFDGFLNLRTPEPIDERFVIVGISEEDLNWLGTPVLSDQVMADLITQINAQQPRMIGLDFYRNLPVEPGQQALTEVLRSTPNLVGIKKVIEPSGESVLSGNPILEEADQLSASDIAVDVDGRVRRGLLFPSTVNGNVLEGLGLRIALDYLAVEGITPDMASSSVLRLGHVALHPLESQTGGYINVDAGGYQILLNPRGRSTAFEIVSLKEVLSYQIPPDLMEDRIVMIGSHAISNADLFYTSTNSSPESDSNHTFGVEIHATLASQIISAVLDGRPLIRTFPEWAEILIIIGFSYLGISLQLWKTSEWQRAVLTVGTGGLSLILGSGMLIWGGLWFPVIPAAAAFICASMMMGFYRTNQLKTLSAKDKLTGLANRHTFDDVLQREWFRALRSQSPLSLIICDVDYFKRYNDTYGHPQGDVCLRSVAKAIKSSVKRSADLAARYGGEEFVVILPNTDQHKAESLAEMIRKNVQDLQLEHKASDVAEHVTLSLGVTTLIPTMIMPTNALIEIADLGLYTAKQSGRNRVVVHLPESFSPASQEKLPVS